MNNLSIAKTLRVLRSLVSVTTVPVLLVVRWGRTSEVEKRWANEWRARQLVDQLFKKKCAGCHRLCLCYGYHVPHVL